ncbi:helix-turn-helix domain-containing protein [Streptomyces otsuchiensis]|uniref:helix-turn-helix domain-containing protein n=1 Tax=Streptomyces otsuchiensis TaxID=2681388 RepID=UPI0010306BC2|nr:helix-turn-helix transcriptional regulator [Streptomyces otsuchiensis]
MALREPYAEELRAQRERAGLTQAELGERLRVHPSLIAHWEAGRRRPCPEDADRLDEVFGTPGTFARFLKPRPYAAYFERAAQAEESAARIEEFAPVYVPGLLQTEAYARQVFRTSRLHWCEEELERYVANRLKRAEILRRDSPEAWFILSESVLRIAVGGPAVMSEQLAHIAELARRHRVLLQVVPFAHGSHSAMGSMLKLMKFAEGPDLAYVEALYTGNVIDADTPEVVRGCRDAYDPVRAAALPPDASLHLLENVMEEYRSYDRTLLPEQRRVAQVQLQRR